MTTLCPICGKPLKLKKLKETKIIGYNKVLGIPELSKTINSYWVCDYDKRKWLRSAVLMKSTSREIKNIPFSERLTDYIRKYVLKRSF